MNYFELREQHLVETDWLSAQIDAGLHNICIVDMCGYVKTETASDGFQTAQYIGALQEYQCGHIPGSVYFDWTKDIVDLTDSIPAQVAPPDKIAEIFGSAGIGDDTLVVAYDHHPAAQFATRLWWVLRYYGHKNVRVLNGGLKKWVDEGRAISTETPERGMTTFTPHIQPSWKSTAEETLGRIGDPGALLIDVRDEGQFAGKIRRGVRGGHIPGAVHLPREAFFTGHGQFRETTELAEMVHSANIPFEKQVIAYCNGGVAATSVLFTLSMLGFEKLSNYDGSWNEWNQRLDLPVEMS